MTLEEFLENKGQKIGMSDWIPITQDEISTFGAVTHDIEPMHTDPKWCAAHSPFGTTIAYGFQTMALLTRLMHSATTELFAGKDGEVNFPLNCGFNRLRLLSPVRVGDSIRGHFRLVDAQERKPGELYIVLNVEVEIEGGTRPALVAEWVLYWITGSGRKNVERSLARNTPTTG